jgi:uncharacterized membrane protein
MSEERAAAVLRVLEAELPPSTVDIDRALRVGRRRERGRRGLAAGALAAVAVVAGVGLVAVDRAPHPPPDRPAASATRSASASAPACVAAVLPGDHATAREISPNGRIVVGVTGDDEVAAVWTDGAFTPLPAPAGSAAEPHGVNDDGVVVGVADQSGRTVPFVVRGGVYSVLSLPSGAQGAAHGVNARGDVVGEVWWPNGNSKAVLWRASGAPVTLASTTAWAGARAIADDGTILGSLDDGATPYAWAPDGTGRALATPDGSKGGKVFGVAGDYAYGPANSTWVRWQLSTGAVVEVVGLEAGGVDATGAVVGSTRQDDRFVPVRWRDGRITVLPGIDGAPATAIMVATSRDGTRLAGGNLSWRC